LSFKPSLTLRVHRAAALFGGGLSGILCAGP
jgi:hypothetical protein